MQKNRADENPCLKLLETGGKDARRRPVLEGKASTLAWEGNHVLVLTRYCLP